MGPKGTIRVQCPKCLKKERQKLLCTRFGPAGSIKRRRKCLGCGAKFTTYERVEELRPLTLEQGKQLVKEAWAKLTLALERMP
jgi:transcriptional regulator NrdR family protein